MTKIQDEFLIKNLYIICRELLDGLKWTSVYKILVE